MTYYTDIANCAFVVDANTVGSVKNPSGGYPASGDTVLQCVDTVAGASAIASLANRAIFRANQRARKKAALVFGLTSFYDFGAILNYHGAVSISGWFAHSSPVGSQNVIFADSAAGIAIYNLAQNEGVQDAWEFEYQQVGATSYSQWSGASTPGNWDFVSAVRHADGTVSMYINGVDSTASHAGVAGNVLGNAVTHFVIGRPGNVGVQYYQGMIESCAIHNRDISLAEHQALYNSMVLPITSPPINATGWEILASGNPSGTFNANAGYMYFNVPILSAGDVYTGGYVTWYQSSDSDGSPLNSVESHFVTNAGEDATGSTSVAGSTLSLVGGPAGSPSDVGTFYPDKRYPSTQGLKVASIIDLSIPDPQAAGAISILQNLNRYNYKSPVAYFSQPFEPAGTWTLKLKPYLNQNYGGNVPIRGSVQTWYNPSLFLFSAVQFPPIIPIGAGGDSVLRKILALGD